MPAMRCEAGAPFQPGGSARSPPTVSFRKSASSGKTQSSGCWPSIAATTEEFDRAGASTKIGENRSGSRCGGFAITAPTLRAPTIRERPTKGVDMARTSLMRALQLLARDHSVARLAGIEVDELRGREEEALLSRRELLERGGALGAAAMAGPGLLAPRAQAAQAPRIAVVGAG